MPKPPLKWTPPEPWDSPVIGHELAAALLADIRRYMRMSPSERAAVTLWTMFTHAHDAFENSPFLAVGSPVPGCGKSRTARLVKAHVPCAMASSNLSQAVLYRSTQDIGPKPTMLLDEADTYLFGNYDMVGILNAGHSRSTSRVHRTGGEDFHVMEFDMWLPKMLIFIGQAPPTLADRSITIRLQRLRSSQSVERIPSGYDEQCEDRRRKLARWALDSLDELRAANPQLPPSLYNRARDNWRPLVAIADLLGGGWPDAARDAAIALSGGASRDTGERLLSDIRDIFVEEDSDFLSSNKMVGALREISDGLWDSFKNGRGLDEQALAKILEPFGIRPKKVNRASARNQRGYDLADFTEAFVLYLPPREHPSVEGGRGER